MGYKDLILHLDLEEFGEGCFVDLRNPDLMPLEPGHPVILPSAPPEDASDEVKGQWSHDYEAALIEGGRRRAKELVLAWKVWDLEGNELPLPSEDPAVFEKVPGGIMAAIGRKLQERRPTNPRTPPNQESTTSTTS